MNYRIGRHMAIKGRDGVFHNPGECMTGTRANELFENVNKLVDDAKLVPADHVQEAQTSPFVGQTPLPNQQPVGTGERTEPRTPPVEIITPRYNAWTLDPSDLAGKDINELNVMISERTPPKQKGGPESFETPEEAIAWLSQDYIAADAPQITAP